jgi:hypothetical protein
MQIQYPGRGEATAPAPGAIVTHVPGSDRVRDGGMPAPPPAVLTERSSPRLTFMPNIQPTVDETDSEFTPTRRSPK